MNLFVHVLDSLAGSKLMVFHKTGLKRLGRI